MSQGFGDGMNKIQLESALARINDRLAEVELKECERKVPTSPIMKPTVVARVEVAHVDPAEQAMKDRLAFLEAENARLKAASVARAEKAKARRRWQFDEIPVNGHIEVEASEATNFRAAIQNAKNSYLKGKDVVFITKTIGTKVMCFRLK